jgi:SAM-dependent methyltransferase
MQMKIDWNFETLSGCGLCGHDEGAPIFERTIRALPLRFVKCSKCGHCYQNPRLTEESLQQYFSSSYFMKDSQSNDYALDDLLGYPDYFAWDACYKKTAKLRLKRIGACKNPPARLLEIGTATGSFLDEARAAGYVVRGLDVSAAFAELAKRKYGLEIDVDFVERFPLPEAHYDIVCCFGGIACWRDPLKGLSNIRRSLKPDGILVLNHPNSGSYAARAQGSKYFEFNHASLSIFSNQSMRGHLERAGFRVDFAQTERQYASLGRIVTYLKQPVFMKLFKRLGLGHWTIPVLAFGTTFCICRPAACAGTQPRKAAA